MIGLETILMAKLFLLTGIPLKDLDKLVKNPDSMDVVVTLDQAKGEIFEAFRSTIASLPEEYQDRFVDALDKLQGMRPYINIREDLL